MTTEHIREQFDTTLNKLDDTLKDVGTQLSEGIDLRQQVQQKPWLMLGAAVAAGYILGSLLGGSDNDDWRDDDWRERPADFYQPTHAQQQGAEQPSSFGVTPLSQFSYGQR